MATIGRKVEAETPALHRAFNMPRKSALALANFYSSHRDHFDAKQLEIIAVGIHDRCKQVEVWQLMNIINRPDLTDMSFYDK